jgi:hypothetical protein
MISLMVPFRTFSFLDFLADLLQKSILVASNLFACCVFSVHVSAPYSKILWTKAWYDRLCGLVVSVEDYKHRGPGFDSRALLRIFLREMGLERGPLSLVIG